MGNNQSQQSASAPALATTMSSMVSMSSRVSIAPMASDTANYSSSLSMSTIAKSSLESKSTSKTKSKDKTETTTLVSVYTEERTSISTEEIISTITKAGAPAIQPQAATVTVEITTTQSVAPQVQTPSSTIQTSESPSASAEESPSASETTSMIGMKGTGTQAGVNTPAQPQDGQSSASPMLQGAQLDPTPPTITQPKVGPFSPVAAILGGIPNKNVDVPATVFFLILFIVGAASHFIRHEVNSKRGHNFVLSDMLFDFCMVRNVTCIMRIVWAFKPANNSVVVAALIFENAGVVVLFAVNIIFTQRILRSLHPNFGWHPITTKLFFVIVISVPMIIIWNIASLTVTFFTLNPRSIAITKNLLLFGSCWTLFLCLFPAIFVTLATAIPSPTPVEKFGSGRFRMKCIVLITAVALLAVGAITRLLGAVIEKPITAPSHLFSKPVFYTTGFMLEIIVVYGYLFLRVDLRFWVPDGTGSLVATGARGSYTVKSEEEDDEENLVGDEKLRAASSLYSKLYADVNTNMVLNPDVRVSSVQQVSAAMEDITTQTKGEVVGTRVESGSEDVVLYAFRVERGGDLDANGMPRPPPRTETWMARERNAGVDTQEFL